VQPALNDPGLLLELSCSHVSLYDCYLACTATQVTAREPNIPIGDFTADALPATTLLIYVDHSMLDCTVWGLVASHLDIALS